MHPPSPWRDALGAPTAYNAAADHQFIPLLDRFGSKADKAIEAAIHDLVRTERSSMAWPDSRRERLKARIVLRRLAAVGDQRSAPWRLRYDVTAQASRSATNTSPRENIKS